MGPHTNMGILALAVMGVQSLGEEAPWHTICPYYWLQAYPKSTDSRTGTLSLYGQAPSAAANLLQILSENSGNFYSDMRLGSYSQRGTEVVNCKPRKVSLTRQPFFMT